MMIFLQAAKMHWSNSIFPPLCLLTMSYYRDSTVATTMKKACTKTHEPIHTPPSNFFHVHPDGKAFRFICAAENASKKKKHAFRFNFRNRIPLGKGVIPTVSISSFKEKPACGYTYRQSSAVLNHASVHSFSKIRSSAWGIACPNMVFCFSRPLLARNSGSSPLKKCASHGGFSTLYRNTYNKSQHHYICIRRAQVVQPKQMHGLLEMGYTGAHNVPQRCSFRFLSSCCSIGSCHRKFSAIFLDFHRTNFSDRSVFCCPSSSSEYRGH